MTANQLIPDMSRPITSIVTPGPVHRPSLSDKGRHLQFQSWSTLPRVCRSRVPPGFIFRSCPPHLHILVPRGGASFPGGGGWEEVEDRTADSAPAAAWPVRVPLPSTHASDCCNPSLALVLSGFLQMLDACPHKLGYPIDQWPATKCGQGSRLFGIMGRSPNTSETLLQLSLIA